MRTWSGLKIQKTGRGFTLVELLLTVALLLLLTGAAVYNFSSLRKGAALEEGATQMTALLRYARSYSVHSGKEVQLTIDRDGVTSSNQAPIRLTCKKHPRRNEGHFERVPEADAYINQMDGLVRVEQAQVLDNSGAGATAVSTNALPEGFELEDMWFDEPQAPVTISFYPDGTCDSSEVVLASKDEDDSRRISLKLAGVVGTIHRSYMPVPGETTEVPEANETGDPLEP